MKSSLSISDLVHGACVLYGIPVHILKTPEFERLHLISQLGLVSKVFPNATHSRKAHSIGAAHIANIWINHLKQISP